MDFLSACGAVWNSQGTALLNGIEEVNPRDSYIWNKHYWFSVDFDSPEQNALARGKLVTEVAGGSVQELNICTLVQPCSANPNSTDRIRVHGVGAFVTDCIDDTGTSSERDCRIIEPEDEDEGLRGFTPFGPSTYNTPGGGSSGNFPGYIIVSDLVEPMWREHPSKNGGCLGNLILPAGLLGWWGPSEQSDTTPNMLTHEILHAATGYTHSATPDASIPNRVLVQDSGALRGFQMDIPSGPFTSTTAQSCQLARDPVDFGGYVVDFAQ